MPFGCGCLLVMGAGVAPRLVLIVMWIFGWRINAAFDSWIWPLLGIVFLPYTTIMYVLAWAPGGLISGWDWVWVGLGVVLDIMKWAQVHQNRREIPGYPQQGY